MKIAILGGRGTGKSSLKEALAKKLPANFHLIDTCAIMDAIHSDPLALTNGLPIEALARQREIDLTLLMGLDLVHQPTEEKGLQTPPRDLVDARLRAILGACKLNYVVVYGQGEARTESALQAIAHHARQPVCRSPEKGTPWQWNCEKCSDGSCEHRIFTGLLT